MKMHAVLFIIMIATVLCGVLPVVEKTTSAAAETPESSPGEYSGFSPVLYDGYKIFSQYVAVRDNTKLAVDIIRPTEKGVVVDKKLPVVWMHTPYNRRYFSKALTAQFYPGAALGLVKYGYVVAVVDKRGFYASFGTTYSLDGWDAYDITEWLATQSFSNGKIGMWGCSATGGSQLAAANLMPPSLKAIFPMSAGMGHSLSFAPSLPPETPKYPPESAKPGDIPSNDEHAVAVDDDPDGILLAKAKDEHRYNYLATVAAPTAPGGLKVPMVKPLLISHAQLQDSKVAMYHAVNWDDLAGSPFATILRYNNLNNPEKLLLGAGTHCIWCTEYSSKEYPLDFNIVTEEHRFFDYWLKGIDNGIMSEPPIHFFTEKATKGEDDWVSSWQWPVPHAKPTNFYFGAGPSGAGYGVNDGVLITTAPTVDGAKDVYTTDYEIPIKAPWEGMVTIITQPLQAEKGLTYTTEPLETDMTLTGHPIVHLWISSTAKDGDFWVDLEDIDAEGNAETIIPLSGSPNTTIAPGKPLPPGMNAFRASHRALSTPDYNRMGLPYHTMANEDAKPLVPGEPTELVFDLRPISYVVEAGHRIRMSITCVVGDATPRLSPAPVVAFYRNPEFSSHVTLPVIAPVTADLKAEVQKADLIAAITFPDALDKRYIEDVKKDSVTCNGVRAQGVKADGNTLTAKFAKSDLPDGSILNIKGKFGGKFNYGNMTFAATGSAPVGGNGN